MAASGEEKTEPAPRWVWQARLVVAARAVLGVVAPPPVVASLVVPSLVVEERDRGNLLSWQLANRASVRLRVDCVHDSLLGFFSRTDYRRNIVGHVGLLKHSQRKHGIIFSVAVNLDTAKGCAS